MTSTNPKVDLYLEEGCGRCPLYRQPDCKAIRWSSQLQQLRQIALDCGAKEDIKWGVPCYTVSGKNAFLVSAFRDYVAVSFFKGVLLNDTSGRLESPGPNSQSALLLRYTSSEQIASESDLIKELMLASLELERSSAKVTFKDPAALDRPIELQERLSSDPTLSAAFKALSPGKRRGYILHIESAKQPATRLARVERCVPKILAGRAFEDRD